MVYARFILAKRQFSHKEHRDHKEISVFFAPCVSSFAANVVVHPTDSSVIRQVLRLCLARCWTLAPRMSALRHIGVNAGLELSRT